MKTLDEVYAIAETLNEEAHELAWDSWIAADEAEESDDEDADVTAEELREDASLEQAEYFRNGYYELGSEDQEAIKHWLTADESFKDEFSSWFGYTEFEEEFGS